MESEVDRLVEENVVFNRLEAVRRLKMEVVQLEFLEEADYLLKTWGRIQPELAFLKQGEDETQVAKWVHDQMPGFGLITLARLATSEEYNLKVRFKLGGIHFTSSFTNRDKDDDGEEEEEEEEEEESEAEESISESGDFEEEDGDDEQAMSEDFDVDQEDYESYEEEEEENSYDDDEEEEDRQPPTGNVSKVAYKLEMIDPSTGMQVVILNLSFTICTSHLPNEILFYDDLTNEDNLNEDIEIKGEDSSPGPMEIFYSTSGYQESTSKWEDEFVAQAAMANEPQVFQLENEMCKCTCCGAEHLYSVLINWPALQSIAFPGSEPSMVLEMGRSLSRTTRSSAFTLIRDVRTLVLLMVLSGAGMSGFVFSPLEFLFQSLLSDVFDRFGTSKQRFDDTIEQTDPVLEVD